MRISIPEFSMVALIGASGSGKSTLCRNHFLPTEVLSSDAFRAQLCDDENDLGVTSHAFEALHFMLAKRLELGRLTVIDATNVQPESRKPLLEIATRYHALKVAIILDTPEATCQERNENRENRNFGPHVVRNHIRDLHRGLRRLKDERWHKVYFLKPEDIANLEIERDRIWSRRPEELGPFDIIGDIHGCMNEFAELLTKLGWNLSPELSHPENRRLIFVGDLVDRGPKSVEVTKIAMDAVKAGKAFWVPGNHDVKLSRALKGKKVTLGHGLRETMEQFSQESEEFRNESAEFIHNLVSHLILDNGKLCVAHAGMLESMQGRGSAAVRDFALFGETSGEIDEFGLPVRYEWAKEYRGKTTVVFGHTPIPEVEWLNNTININTGCCFGGKLTALRYPEREIVQVEARETYAIPARPIGVANSSSSSAFVDDVLDLQDVIGRRAVDTKLGGRITVREENAIAALEVMSRFAADPRWLIYLPPTMSPCRTAERDDYLEYPLEALQYYHAAGIAKVICEEKHMGSRAVAIVCDSAESAAKRFGIENGETGIIYTRTGRRFFDDLETETQLLAVLRESATSAGIFSELNTSWLAIDMELMPWSAKAVGLLRDQYAPVGAAAIAHAAAWKRISEGLIGQNIEGAGEFALMAEGKMHSAVQFRESYRRYCWRVNSLEDYKIAPFHLLASEGEVHSDKSHEWHMEILAKICAQNTAILVQTPYRIVQLDSTEEIESVCKWWEELIDRGGEGMVVKPLQFVAPDPKGNWVQPAIKCRGREYLRIIYGPEYLEPQNLNNLKKRGLGRKRSLASREFALGIEALERFVSRKSLREVHECVFAVLALESEPVDPRL